MAFFIGIGKPICRLEYCKLCQYLGTCGHAEVFGDGKSHWTYRIEWPKPSFFRNVTKIRVFYLIRHICAMYICGYRHKNDKVCIYLEDNQSCQQETTPVLYWRVDVVLASLNIKQSFIGHWCRGSRRVAVPAEFSADTLGT